MEQTIALKYIYLKIQTSLTQYGIAILLHIILKIVNVKNVNNKMENFFFNKTVMENHYVIWLADFLLKQRNEQL